VDRESELVSSEVYSIDHGEEVDHILRRGQKSIYLLSLNYI
jgi:hypothetical protein